LLRGPRIDGALSESGDARQDLVGTFGPDEGLGIGLMGVDELIRFGFYGYRTLGRPPPSTSH